MSEDLILQIFRDFLKTTLLLAAPALIVSMGVGLVISIFQAATQIHEMTLVFVPKVLAIMFVLLILSPWLMNTVVTYTAALLTNIPNYVK